MMEFLIRARRPVVVAVVLAVSAAYAAELAAASPLRQFTYTGAGTNTVHLQTGALRERWTGHAKPLGKITARVAGRIALPTPASLVVHTRMVIIDRSGDKLVGTCTGKGVPPKPKGWETWTCKAAGGTGKFQRSRGRWTLHIAISRVSAANGVQKNRFTETGAGHISWNAGR
jgi:hypothetical protein